MSEASGRRETIIKRVSEAAVPAVITGVIFIAVLIIKGIWPFGKNLIDYYDMGQTNAPLYYHIWDFFHRRSALFFDWYINGGQNLSMGSAIQWNISPFNLFFLLIPRDLVYPSLSLFTGLRLMFMSFNMGLFLKYLEPDRSKPFFLTASVAYGLSGYTLTHYTIPTYLDTAAFVPLLALSLIRLLRGKGKALYGIMLGFTTALSYYLSFMNLIYILLFSGIYILLIAKDPEKKRKCAFDLAVGTVYGLALSSFMLIPSVVQMRSSSRFNSNLSKGIMETLIPILNSVGADQYYVKFFMVYALELFIVIILYGALLMRKEKSLTAALLLTAFIPCALMIFESINILWHFGTYYHYPIRCGYLIPFSLIAVSAAFHGKLWDREQEMEKISVKTAVLLIPGIALLTILAVVYGSRESFEIKELFRIWTLAAGGVFLIMALTPLVIKLVKKTDISKAVAVSVNILIPLTCSELIMGAYAGYGMPKFTDTFFSDPEQSGDYILKAGSFSKAAEDALNEDDSLYRIRRMKNPDTDLNANYGMVIRHGTVGGWANTATSEMIKSAEKLGYSTHFMRILDSGGTFFTDSLLQVKDIVSERDISGRTEGIYSQKGEYETDNGRFFLYNNNCSLPFTFTVAEDIKNIRFEDNSIAENQNLLYKALGGEENIADVIKISELNDNISFEMIGNEKHYKVSLDKKQAVYLSRGSSDRILVNGETLPVPSIGDLDNTAYPAWFNSNLVLLGIFEDETLDLVCGEKSRLILLDIDKLEELSRSLTEGSEVSPTAGVSDLTFNIKGTGDKRTALIPISYSPGWKAYVNGKKIAPSDFNGLFMTLPLAEGENSVRLVFSPPGLNIGMVISFLALLMMYLSVYIKFFINPFWINHLGPVAHNISYTLFCAVFFAAAAALYIIPIIWFVVHEIVKHIA